jgi:hypothetical protein
MHPEVHRARNLARGIAQASNQRPAGLSEPQRLPEPTPRLEGGHLSAHHVNIVGKAHRKSAFLRPPRLKSHIPSHFLTLLLHPAIHLRHPQGSAPEAFREPVFPAAPLVSVLALVFFDT